MRMVSRLRALALKVSVPAVALLGSVSAFAQAETPATFTPPTGMDASTLFTSIISDNKSTIMYGVTALAFLAIIGGLVRKFTRKGAKAAG
jgi:hypothetical protein